MGLYYGILYFYFQITRIRVRLCEGEEKDGVNKKTI